MIRKGVGTRNKKTKTSPNRSHLKHHLHLTNCIHLKHMHKSRMKHDARSPSEFSLLKELSILRKSRSLKDPPTSPSRWKSSPLLQKLRPVQSRSQVFPDVRTAEDSVLLGMEDNDAESSDRDGWVEISPEDGKTINVAASSYHYGVQANASRISRLNPDDGCRRPSPTAAISHNPNPNFDSDAGSKHSHLLNAIRKLDLGKQERYADLFPRKASAIYGGVIGREEAKTKMGRNGESTVLQSGNAAKSSRSRNKGGKKGNLRRSRKLKSVSAHTKATREEERQQWSRRLAVMVRGGTGEAANELDISELPRHGCGTHLDNWSRIRGDAYTTGHGKNLSTCTDPRGAGRPSEAASLAAADASSPDREASDFSGSSFGTDSDSFPLLQRSVPSESGGDTISEPAAPSPAESLVLLPNHGRHHPPQSFSEKYSPQNFREIVGQTLITQALSNALAKRRISPVYIFGGPRGVGKSSCARVLSLALNCVSTSRDQIRPCGSCSQCLAQMLGKSSAFREMSASAMASSKGIKKLLHESAAGHSPLRYRVFMANQCQTLSNQSWEALIRIVKTAPRNVVFVFSTNSMEKLPHSMVSGYQKFIFSKIKQVDIMKRIKMIAENEGIEIEAEALRLIASACDGSLHDAETMFDQLSLLDQKISLAMTQDMMGIIPDGQLIDLLDFALSADTLNTVQSLKTLMISGVDPLNLMSQLACLITSILAGGYRIPKGKHRRRFFRRNRLGKKDMELLRQALKTLSEAEKQLRASSDQTTWLTAALLQLAPDRSFLLPSSSYNTSVTPSSEGLYTPSATPEMDLHDRSQSLKPRSSREAQQVHLTVGSVSKDVVTGDSELEEVWQRILDAVRSISLRKFLRSYGKLSSLSLRAGFASVVLQFHELENVCKAERLKASIAHAFQATLGYPMVDIKLQMSSTMEGPMQGGSTPLPENRTCSSAGSLRPDRRSNHLKTHLVANKFDSEGKYDVARSQGLHYRRYQSHEKSMELGGPSSAAANPPDTRMMDALGRDKDVTVDATDSNDPEQKPENVTGSSSEIGSKVRIHGGRSEISQKNHMHGSSSKTVRKGEGKADGENEQMNEICGHGGCSTNDLVEERTMNDRGMDTQPAIEEENLRLESRSSRLLCWHTGDEKINQTSSSHPRSVGLLWRFCSCGNSEHC